MSEKFKPYAASLTLLVRDNRVLLIRRANTGWLDGYYTVPSGHVNEGESASVAAARETHEEVGLQVDPVDLSMVHSMYRKSAEDGKIYVDFFFMTTKWDGEPVNCELDKCDDIAWFDMNQLPENTAPHLQEAIAKYRAHIHYSEMGW